MRMDEYCCVNGVCLCLPENWRAGKTDRRSQALMMTDNLRLRFPSLTGAAEKSLL